MLRQVFEQQLTGIKVYKVGDKVEKQVYLVGKTPDGRWAGLKTTVSRREGSPKSLAVIARRANNLFGGDHIPYFRRHLARVVHTRVMMKAPNEKLIETLFNHYALRILGDSGVTVYTPSTREEYKDGYDARLMGANAFDELLLQFKTPALLDGSGYSFATTEHQSRRLRKYTPNTAFYVTHTFESVHQIRQTQQDAAEDADTFLRRYVAIEIKGLDDEASRFWYYAPAPTRRTGWGTSSGETRGAARRTMSPTAPGGTVTNFFGSSKREPLG